jgi:hypothetical protein
MRHYTSSAEQYHRPYNTAAGYRALAANTTGRLGTAAGVNALLRNTTGQENTAVGVDAMLQQRDREQITRNFHYCLSDHQCAGEGKQFRRPRTSIGDDRSTKHWSRARSRSSPEYLANLEKEEKRK